MHKAAETDKKKEKISTHGNQVLDYMLPTLHLQDMRG